MGEKMVEKVTRIMQKPDNIRNIGIAAHIDHGKTTFSDNLLAGAGMMSEDLAGKACVLDFHDDEKNRGITIDTASVSMVHEIEGKEFLINLLDTPGHVDFGGDVTRAMRAVDGAVVLCCASEGIMPQTETVLRQALKERVKPILFINKVDRLIKELQLTPEAMQERFIDIINNVNKFIRSISPDDYKDKWQVLVQEGSVCFGSAYHNWAMSFPYMKKHNLTFKDVIDAYTNDTVDDLKKRAPLHTVVLDAVVEHLPNPASAQAYRVPKIWHGELDSPLGKSLVNCDPTGPMAFVITKVVIDPQAGEISAGRLFSGTMTKGTDVFLSTAKKNLRVQQVFIYNGAKREIVDRVPAGNFIGVAGIKAMPGETVSSEEMEPFEQIKHIFEPVITKAVEAKNPADLSKLVEVLKKIGKEDPSIQIEIKEETGEHLMSGMGELHLEVTENRIKSEKGVDIKTSPPIVVYRESILKPSTGTVEGKSPNKHNKFYFRVEPLDPDFIQAIKDGEIPEMRIKKKDQTLIDKMVNLGMDSKTASKVKDVCNGSILIDATRGIVHIGEVIEMVTDMFKDVMNAGPIAREPCFGVKVFLEDTKLHEDAIHRGPAQVYPAVREGLRGAINLASPVLYEPIQEMLLEAPSQYMGELSKLVANKRGQLLEMNQEADTVVARAKLPVAETLGLASELRSATGGRGFFSMVDQTFERVPGEIQNKIVPQIRERKGLKKEEEAPAE